MEFSWNWSASFLREFAAKAGSVAHREVHKRMRASVPVRSRVAIDVPFGTLCVTGSDGTQAELEIEVRGRNAEPAQSVSYTTRERDGITEILVDGPLGSAANLTTVDVRVRVPRGVPVVARCGMGTLRASETGAIEAHANMGAVELTDVRGGCKVRANMGAVTVRLSPLWQGNLVDIRANMGRAVLQVPQDLRFQCSASSSLGRVAIGIGSYENAPPASVHSNLGSVSIEPVRRVG